MPSCRVNAGTVFFVHGATWHGAFHSTCSGYSPGRTSSPSLCPSSIRRTLNWRWVLRTIAAILTDKRIAASIACGRAFLLRWVCVRHAVGGACATRRRRITTVTPFELFFRAVAVLVLSRTGAGLDVNCCLFNARRAGDSAPNGPAFCCAFPSRITPLLPPPTILPIYYSSMWYEKTAFLYSCLHYPDRLYRVLVVHCLCERICSILVLYACCA